MALISYALVVLAALVAVPVAVFCLEIAAAVLTRRQESLPSGPRPRIAVLVPARNEGAAIVPTLTDLRSQLRPDDRLLVVADNCTDDTAVIAKQMGAEVTERHDPSRIGKGYALDFGLEHLASNSPDVVVMIDADCRLAPDAIDHLAATCSVTGRPVQARYLMKMPEGSPINHQIAEFAWRVKNWVRPAGLAAGGFPCQLNGAGMAFPWPIIRGASLAHSNIVEDLKLGLDLTKAGHPPLFCAVALVTSNFAASARGASVQRQRWEHGHIGTILQKGPGLLWTAIARARLDLLALTLDLMVPPLSLLVLMLSLVFVITGIAALFGLGVTAWSISLFSTIIFTAAIVIGWHVYGREVLPAGRILSIPNYIFSKLGLYRQALLSKTTPDWIGTDRASKMPGHEERGASDVRRRTNVRFRLSILSSCIGDAAIPDTA